MLDRLYIVVEMLAITLCLHQLYGKKYAIEYKTMVLMVIDLLIIQGVNEKYFPQGCIALIYIIIVYYCKWKFKSSLKTAIINTIICAVLSSFLQIISITSVARLANLGISESVIFLFGNSIMAIIYIALARTSILYKISQFFQKKDVILYLVLVGGVVGIAICANAIRQNFGLYEGQYLFLWVILIILFLMTVSWKMYKDKALENELELRAHKMYEQSYENLISEIRVKQHDVKNHINAIFLQHITCNTYEELVERQKQACQEILAENKFIDLLTAGNPTVIGFLFSKFTEAIENEIEVEYEVRCGELNMDVPIYKINTILGNLIDNAIEALA